MNRKRFVLSYILLLLLLANVPALGNSTVLIANFLNGNNDFLQSRVYLWNPSASAGTITARAYRLPKSGPSLFMGAIGLGLLEATSARNINIAEDVLGGLGIPLPYTIDGGNLVVEFTVEADNVTGDAQVFSDTFGFGTYPLQEMPSISGGSPTVLVANFLNGNDASLNARVYLWNPSNGAGNITAQAFTLPKLGPSTVLGTVPRGLLEARSGRNINIAEDILEASGIPLPYIEDGGNLVVEFTIEADNVRGNAQVFSDSFGFGTYPLEISQGLLARALSVLEDTVSISQPSPGGVTIKGALQNTLFQDATSIEVAIAAFDNSGRMVGGGTTIISGGTLRKQGASTFTNKVLLPDDMGYFESFFAVTGTVQTLDFFVVATEQGTSAPETQITVTSSAVANNANLAEVSGTVTNEGEDKTANFISIEMILLDDEGRVLEILSAVPDQTTLVPAASSNFTQLADSQFHLVDSVVFSVIWSE